MPAIVVFDGSGKPRLYTTDSDPAARQEATAAVMRAKHWAPDSAAYTAAVEQARTVPGSWIDAAVDKVSDDDE